jgi:hypothetical protein
VITPPLPATGDALRKGELSPEQADVVVGAASANPRAERSLLKQAQTMSFAELREEVLPARAAGEDRGRPSDGSIRTGGCGRGPMPRERGT